MLAYLLIGCAAPSELSALPSSIQWGNIDFAQPMPEEGYSAETISLKNTGEEDIDEIIIEDLQNDFQVSGEAGVCPPNEDCNHLCLQGFDATPASLLQGSLPPGETFNAVISVCNYIEQAGERDDNITGNIEISFSGSDKPIYIDWSFTPVQNLTSP